MEIEHALVLKDTKDCTIADQVRHLVRECGPVNIVLDEYLPDTMVLFYLPTQFQRATIFANRSWAVRNFINMEHLN
jgi:hypothetical protein